MREKQILGPYEPPLGHLSVKKLVKSTTYLIDSDAVF